jgi:hypothetical protein
MSYSLFIVESNQTWPHRLDHYFDLGEAKVDLEHVAICAIVLIISSLIFACILTSALNKDGDALKILRKTWRQKISKKRNSTKSIRHSEGEEVVPASRETAVDAPLKREVAWKKLHGDVFRKPNFSTSFCTLIG